MKKTIFIGLLAFGLLNAMDSVFAANITCPSADIIKNKNFVEARPLVPQENGWLWVLSTRPFADNKVAWSVWMGAVLPVMMQDEAEAIKQGQALLSKSILISNPEPKIHETSTECVYNKADDKFVVEAVSPPEDFPDSISRLRA